MTGELNEQTAPQVTVVITCRERHQLTEVMLEELYEDSQVKPRIAGDAT